MDEEAGPIVRPYALIGGRTRSSGDALDLVALITATGNPPTGRFFPSPEQERILSLVTQAISVADVASELDLPLGVVRVLLGDLQDHKLISVGRVSASERILKEVINGLRAL
ncbi:hypothetical protein GCM10017673_27200 [Streptosporangium violaceochromogenes]|nr:hypothetical protein GCM10017673_27200 [Streptosporangium violaceochromogenes]